MSWEILPPGLVSLSRLIAICALLFLLSVMASTSYSLAPFNGKTDFCIWKQKIKCILIQQRVFKAINHSYADKETEENKAEMNELACSTIILNLSDSVLRKVGILESAKDLWEKLEDLYTENSLPSRMYLLEKFFRFKLDLSKDIDENLDAFTKLVQDIKLCGDKHIDDYTPIVLLNAIPDSYADVKSAIKYGRDNIDVDTVINALKSKELDLKHGSSVKSSDKVMHVRGRSSKPNHRHKHTQSQSHDRKHDHNQSKHRSKSRPKGRKCFNCGDPNHYIKDCPKPPRKKKDEHANVVSSDDKLGEVFMVSDMCSTSDVNAMHSDLGDFDWLVDSGCTFHMTPHKHLFSTYVAQKHGYVSMANEKKCEVAGLGDICLKFSTGSLFTLKNVRHVPDLCYNLLSCAALETEGLAGRWGNGIMKIMKGSLILFKAVKLNNLYICHAEPTCETMHCLNSVQNDKTILWHNRLGHMSNKGLEILKKDGVFGNDSIFNVPFCDACVLGKQHKVQFPVSSYPNMSKCADILEYLHADVWGPSGEPTQGGNRYFLSIIDDFSRKVWVFLMKHKSDVFMLFKNWKIKIELQTGKKIKALRTDNGLEFCNKPLDDLCVESGIKRHRSVPYTPQQNGVAERMNRTLLERVRSLLATSGLAKNFWGEAVHTAAYIINRSPSVPLKGKCPESVFTGKPIEFSHLRVFGCAAFVHQKLDKLEPRSKKCVFLGYPEGVKGYRVWCRSEPGFKVQISRDVVFNEFDFPCLTPAIPAVADVTSNEVEHVSKLSKRDNLPAENDEHDEHDNIDNSQSDNSTLEHENLDDYQLARDRARRTIKKPNKFLDCNLSIDESMSEFAFNVFESLDEHVPESYKTALTSDNANNWIKASDKEMGSMHTKKTWILVPKPPKCSLVDCKWLFKVKEEAGKKIYKARLVAKGFTQKEGIDYNEIFAPVVKFTSVRIMLALVAHFNWEMKQMDVTTAFLHGDLDYDIYMKQPEGYVDPNYPEHVCLLKKAIYGLKQSPRQWNIKFDECMQSLNFKKSNADHCLYFKLSATAPVFLLLYVDDMLIVSPCLKSIKHVQTCLCANFEMKDLGDAKKILGMNIVRDRQKCTLILNQISYVEKVLSKFGMSACKPASVPLAAHFSLSKDQSPTIDSEINEMKKIPYANAIGSVMYLMVSTRPDIAYTVSCLSRYMSNPGKPHWEAMKWLLRYLKHTSKCGLTFYKSPDDVSLVGYVDSNYANDRDNRKSTTSYVFTLCGACISWKSQLQPIVALSTTESEYVAATEAMKEAIWLKGLLNEIGFLKNKVVLFSDSQSAIQLCKNPVFHDRTKHIDVRFHYIRDIVEQGLVYLEKISTDYNPADMGTKCLSVDKLLSCMRILNFDFG